MKGFIRRLLEKQIVLGSLSVKLSTVAVTAVSVLVVGGTAGAVAIQANTQRFNETVQVADMGRQTESPAAESDEQQTASRITGAAEESANGGEAHTHTFLSKVLSESTCTVQGEAEETCTECGYSYTYKLPLAAHEAGDWTEILKATETAEGLRERRCTNCDTLLATEVIAVVPHNHVYVVTAGESESCESDGYTTYTCTICGSNYTEGIGATGHSYDEQIVEEATCTAQGHIYQKCITCVKTIETAVIPATGHRF